MVRHNATIRSYHSNGAAAASSSSLEENGHLGASVMNSSVCFLAAGMPPVHLSFRRKTIIQVSTSENERYTNTILHKASQQRKTGSTPTV